MSFKLARMIYDDGYKPDKVVTIFRGGTIPFCYVHEALKRLYQCKITGLDFAAESYDEEERIQEPKFRNLESLFEEIKPDDNLLLIDDVHDTGHTLRCFLEKFREKFPKLRLKIATVYYKPGRSEVNIKPDYFVEETDDWIVFPHEITDMDDEQFKKADSEGFKILYG